jgi:predicted enzyme related to lactoylglutathione lyase
MATIRQEGAPRRAGLGRLDVVALDGPDLDLLAGFYSELTGWPIVRKDEDWYQLGRPDTGGATLAFQLAPDHRPPVWPSADRPQQLHLDFVVDDLDAAVERAVRAGATLERRVDHPGFWRLAALADPFGHGFDLIEHPEAGYSRLAARLTQ